ncbi:MAG TPA: histidine kinase, partial [Burkholderiaceae bacterium]
MTLRILNCAIANEQDIVAVRQRARQICALLDFSVHDQVRLATAVSEVARAALATIGISRAIFSIE